MIRKKINSAMLVLAIVLTLGIGTARSDIYVQCPADIDGVDTDGDTVVDNDYYCRHLAAGDGFINMADGKLLYIFGFSDADGVNDASVIHTNMLAAEFTAPNIEVKEGQRVFLSLSNVGMMMRPDLFDPHSIHWHGFPQAAPIFDGVPEPSVSVNMGSSFTFYYEPVDAGTYIYHCHVEATEHMQMGMLGQLYVLPKQNNLPEGTDLNGFTHHTGNKYAYNDGDGSTYYDVQYPMQMNSMDPVFHDQSLEVQHLPMAQMSDRYPLLNGRGYPDTINPAPIANTFDGNLSQKLNAIITAQKGQKVLIRFSCLSVTQYFTMTILGIPMKVIAKGGRMLRGPTGLDMSYMTNSITLGGGEATDVILDTANITPGTYFLYTTNLNYLSNDGEDYGGMMTEITITPAP